MRATKAYGDVLRFRRPVIATGEVAALLRVPRYSASRLLRRLSRDGVVMPIRRGLWSVGRQPDPCSLAAALTAPYPSYVSVWSALYRHGMIDQVPRDIYVVSLDRSKQIKTPVARFVVHHLAPRLFGGFETKEGVTLATPEKALFDVVYLTCVRGRRFAALPEIELPVNFDEREVWRWVERIRALRLRTLVRERLDEVLGRAERDEAGS
jgi:predicted transcriptional regulator of viral defense system